MADDLHAASARSGIPHGTLDRRRLAVLDSYAIVDTPPEPAFDDVAALAAAICGTPISAVSLVCADRQFFKANIGFDATETPVEHSFCAHAIADGEAKLFQVNDAACDPRFLASPFVTGDPNIRFYAGMPLFSREGTGMGALCVIDTAPRADGLSDFQRMALKTLADQVAAQLELRRTIAERDARAAEQQATAEDLRWLASHDPLTGLGNRALFHERLQQAIASSSPERRTALLLLDVDHFKQVNDTLGHDAGDSLLRAIAIRLSAVTRSTDTVARLGGDEFGIILHGIDTQQDIAAITDAIFNRLQQPVFHRDRPIETRATIGAAISPDHAVDADELIGHADVALYAAKSAGRGRAALFDPTMLVAAKNHAAMISRARTALATDEITPFYQPKVDLATGALCGFEALLRVCDPDGQVRLPATIGAAFEDPEIAVSMGAAMIRQIAADVRAWRDAGLAFGRVAINASACEIRDGGFAPRLLDALAAADLPPTVLELEVTETVLLDRDAAHVDRVLKTLAAAGVRIALDDFGTGYASLSHLDRFPVHLLKIDQSFVHGIFDGGRSGVIVTAILNLAENLGIETVAEGIETEAQAQYLREKGCRTGQGHLFSRALPAHAIPGLIGTGIQLARGATSPERGTARPWPKAA